MYLVDTNVISEARKRSKANKGVRAFFKQVIEEQARIYISVVTLGELRRGVELIRHRGDVHQANQLENWLNTLLAEYQGHLLDINQDVNSIRYCPVPATLFTGVESHICQFYQLCRIGCFDRKYRQSKRRCN